ncbi:hypothetical protein CFP56_037922 [Quercus suber]|uniref:Uncharacterized protein n=1 Tax=Quercus suber TaxID=58331 RepID=A0AAW0J3J5_QUESU
MVGPWFVGEQYHYVQAWEADFHPSLIRFKTTRKFEFNLIRNISGNPIPDSSLSCMFLPAPYIGLFFVSTYKWYNVEPLSAYSFGPYT